MVDLANSDFLQKGSWDYTNIFEFGSIDWVENFQKNSHTVDYTNIKIIPLFIIF